METLKRKLSSRKLWAAVVGVIIGLATMFGLDGGAIDTVSGAVMCFGSLISYIITEGKIDANAAKQTIEYIQEAKKELDEIED